MTNLIIPSAGHSSRFPDKPKWLLINPSGNTMLYDSISGLNLENITNIYITVVEEHVKKYLNNDMKKITDMFKDINFPNENIYVYVMKNFTSSQCETVVKTINHFNINGSIFIKDVDNYFEYTPKKEKWCLLFTFKKL